MTQIQAVRSSQHGQYSWVPYNQYGFAAADIYAPLLVQEFHHAGAASPIAFVFKDQVYSPVMMMGLPNGTNLLVSSKGRWLGNYVPAYYRSHPFCMAKDQQGKILLSVRSDSECVLDRYVPDGKAKPFFVDGELSKELSEIRNFLQNVEAGRLATAEFCAACAKLDLFVPWDLRLEADGRTLNIKGLYRVDETRLRALPADSAKVLLGNGTLGAIYYHLGSLQLTKKLLSLKQSHDDGATRKDVKIPEIFTHGAMDEPVGLNWSSIVKS